MGRAGLKLVRIDLQRWTTTEAPDCSGNLNIGGISDAVFIPVAAASRLLPAERGQSIQ